MNINKNLNYLMIIFTLYYKKIRKPKNIKLIINVIRYNPPSIKKTLLFTYKNTLIYNTIKNTKHITFKTHNKHKINKSINNLKTII